MLVDGLPPPPRSLAPPDAHTHQTTAQAREAGIYMRMVLKRRIQQLGPNHLLTAAAALDLANILLAVPISSHAPSHKTVTGVALTVDPSLCISGLCLHVCT